MREEDINEQKIRVAYSKQIEIHISLKDGSWRNGFVKELYPDFFLFWDWKDKENEPVFYMELSNVRPFIREEKRKDEEM